MVQFHRISDGLGDFGMIRVSPWLHPVLDRSSVSMRVRVVSLNQGCCLMLVEASAILMLVEIIKQLELMSASAMFASAMLFDVGCRIP